MIEGMTVTETTIEFTELLGRRVRMGTWEDQKISTYRKILEAIDEGRWDDAAQLESYFVDEASVCFAIYRQWNANVRNYLLGHDVDPRGRGRAGRAGDRGRQAARRVTLGAASTVGPAADGYPGRDCRDLPAAGGPGTGAHGGGQGDLASMPRPGRGPRVRPDVLVKEQLGELAIRDMYDVVLLPLFAWRYAKFDIDKHPWDEALEVLMLVACEAMRGHLVGPERTGDMELGGVRGPVRPPVRSLWFRPANRPGRLDRGHAATYGTALRLDGGRG